jgi:hypothetical protein
MKLPLVVAVGAAVVGLAAPAHADQNTDSQFLAALNQAGINYQNPAQAVLAGQGVCMAIEHGSTPKQVIRAMKKGNVGFTADHAARFTTIAMTTYCPQYLGPVKE